MKKFALRESGWMEERNTGAGMAIALRVTRPPRTARVSSSRQIRRIASQWHFCPPRIRRNSSHVVEYEPVCSLPRRREARHAHWLSSTSRGSPPLPPARTRNATGSTVAKLAGFMTAGASFGILLSPRVSSVSAAHVSLWRSGVGIMGGRQYQANLPASLTVLIRRPIHRGNTSCIYTVTPSG